MEDAMENDILLKICLRALAIVGQWPLKFKKYKLLNYVHVVYSIILSMCFISFVITEYIEIAHRLNDNFLDILNNLSVSLLYTVTICKVIVIRSSAMRKLVDHVRALERIIMDGDDANVKEIYMSHVNWNRKLSKLFIYLTAFTLLTFFVDPIIINMTIKPTTNETNNDSVPLFPSPDKPLPFSSWFPFDRNYYYVQAYTIQLVAGLIGGYLTCDTDIFYWAMMIFGISQIKILQHKLKTLHPNAMKMAAKCNVDVDEVIHVCVRKCVLLHQLVIRYITDFDFQLRQLMLMDFAICSMQIGVIGFQIIVTGFGSSQIFAIEYLMAMLFQMFIFYWHANEIIVESENIALAAWNSEFYKYSPSIQKSLQFLMMRAQDPLKLNVGPFYAMSTATAISIVRGGYSYVALMRQVYK